MNKLDLIVRVRAYTRDFTETVFREEDIVSFLNEGIDRVIEVIPILNVMPYLSLDADVVKYMPREYHHLLAVYASARCFDQDERSFYGVARMNEFETKLQELESKINSGEVVIKNDAGVEITNPYKFDYVENVYFTPQYQGQTFDVPSDDD